MSGTNWGNKIEADLWNNPIGAFKGKHKTEPRGHAGIKGHGPAGEKCKTCRHLCYVEHANRYLKCRLAKHRWTGGTATDVRAGDAACGKWERGDE